MFNQDLQTQIDYLEKTLAKSEVISKVLELAPKLGLPDWYLGAGAIAQTIWNELHNFPLEQGIKDCDLVYFDTDSSYEAEDKYIQKAKKLFKDVSVEVEVRNEARVHLWYGSKHGKEIKPYTSTEDAINTWPTTATATGVRYQGSKLVVYAPYGLNDMMGLIARANKGLITREVYEKKIERWQQVWPKLTVIPWDA
jgi:hypothetical protein